MAHADVLEVTKEEVKVKAPSMYKVVFHNDNVTTYNFVVYVLMTIFNKTPDAAFEITMAVDKNGSAVAGVYTKEIAEHKVGQTKRLAEEHGYPLKVTAEKE